MQENEKEDRRLTRAIEERKEYAECNYEDGYEFTDDDAIEELMGDCGQDASGYCSMAGTEYCDWECPFS